MLVLASNIFGEAWMSSFLLQIFVLRTESVQRAATVSSYRLGLTSFSTVLALVFAYKAKEKAQAINKLIHSSVNIFMAP